MKEEGRADIVMVNTLMLKGDNKVVQILKRSYRIIKQSNYGTEILRSERFSTQLVVDTAPRYTNGE